MISEEEGATRAIVLQVGDRFFAYCKNKRVQTAWSLAGAKLFLENDAKIIIAENILKEKGYTSIRKLVVLQDEIKSQPVVQKSNTINKMENILKLSKYGLVETCKLVHEDVVTIVISKGFSEDAFKTFDFLRECHESFPNHPILETFITRKDLAVVVLKSNESQETDSE